jgi:hypothetical protein
LEEDVLQDIVSQVFVADDARNQEKEQGAISVDQHFERILIADVYSVDQDIIRQV